MKKIKITILSLVLTASTLVAHSQETRIKLNNDAKKSSITYAMNHPLHAWTGVSTDVSSVIVTNEAKNTINQVAVKVTIASFNSKNANRDSHTIEVTEALTYPSVSFASKSIEQHGDSLNITGTLNFHGVNKIISFEATMKKANKKIEVIGNFEFNMTDYNIEPPTLMGIAADDAIKLSFDVIYLE